MTELDTAFRAAGAAAWGSVKWSDLVPSMSQEAIRTAEDSCPYPAVVLVAAFPYYVGTGSGNLSVYARGADYHRVVTARLNTVCTFLSEKYPSDCFCAAADNSPLPEREAARLAGLGMNGRNGLLILPPYGTYIFLGTILTSAPLPVPQVEPAPNCPDCGRCIAACPGHALSKDGFQISRCLSHLTQKKGVLSAEEISLLSAHPLIWGCDTCQQVCPFNAHPAETSLPEFRENLINSLSEENLDGLTNRTFREKYGSYAFSWRGPAVLRRNLELHKTEE